MSKYFKVTTEQYPKATIFAKDTDEVRQIAEAKGHKLVTIHGYIPYPTMPYLNRPEDDKCPSFCFGGSECVNRSACPRDWACND